MTILSYYKKHIPNPSDERLGMFFLQDHQNITKNITIKR